MSAILKPKYMNTLQPPTQSNVKKTLPKPPINEMLRVYYR
jgi:hypothetical protein